MTGAFPAGVIAASGTLAQIIPPSLVLIIMADQLGKSVGDMYKGAFLPGFMLMGLYVLYVVFLAIFKPTQVPALPPEARTFREPDGSGGYASLVGITALSAVVAVVLARNMEAVHTWFQGREVTFVATDEKVVVAMCGGVFVALVIALINKGLKLNLLSRLAERVTFVLIPPLLLIFLVLGTIFLGVATPTEGGAMGAMGALVMAWVRRRMSFSLLKQALGSTTRLSSFVMFILIGATVFSLVFQAADGPIWVEHLLSSLPGGPVGFLIAVNVLVFFLAFFLDYFELSFIVVPLLAPVAHKLGIDLIWFGVLLAVNMQTSFMHPPFGFALFFLRSVAPRETVRGPRDPEGHGAGHDDADLQGRDPVRADPAHHGGHPHRVPADRDGQPGQGGEGQPRRHRRADAREPEAGRRRDADRPLRHAGRVCAEGRAGRIRRGRPRHARAAAGRRRRERPHEGHAGRAQAAEALTRFPGSHGAHEKGRPCESRPAFLLAGRERPASGSSDLDRVHVLVERVLREAVPQDLVALEGAHVLVVDDGLVLGRQASKAFWLMKKSSCGPPSHQPG
jgi:TRAP-type mannitol/chloroaromatic compound transport system permease large subunit